MKLLDVLKTVGKIAEQEAPTVIGLVNPAAGALAQSLTTSIIAAQAKGGVGNGAAKKQTALELLSVAQPLLIQLFESASGKKVDEQQFGDGVSKSIDGLVEILNAAGILPKAV